MDGVTVGNRSPGMVDSVTDHKLAEALWEALRDSLSTQEHFDTILAALAAEGVVDPDEVNYKRVEYLNEQLATVRADEQPIHELRDAATDLWNLANLDIGLRTQLLKIKSDEINNMALILRRWMNEWREGAKARRAVALRPTGDRDE